ncbi:phospholipase D family protein [bacterium]|nr:phospholipase D family protein [bacterium]MBU1435460.1 phospholipase D family protein [bacterium]MBU1502616.1 phospholipase D family protein [bacterium]
MKKLIKYNKMLIQSLLLTLFIFVSPSLAEQNITIENIVTPLVEKHPDKTGLYVLEKGGEALLTRGWLADRATKTIDVQYFIWGNDNIGKLAAETLLRAAERGVHVRVLVDDFLMDAESDEIFAMAYHPNIEIRLYNPVHSVGVNFFERLTKMVIDFRGSNQRMHNKMFVVDNTIAITGGRNMENQYFDFGHAYNYRDRDVLLVGDVITQLSDTFEEFWNDDLAKPVEQLLSNPFSKHDDKLEIYTQQQVNSIYKNLHAYAQDESNYLPEVRKSMDGINSEVVPIIESAYWLDATFISDRPGKNNTWFNYYLGGGGDSTTALAQLLNSAKDNVVIQSPYLILSSDAWDLFEAALARGVSIKICTNSLAASDNLPAFSGYSAQIDELLDAGIEVYEYRHDAKRRYDLVKQYSQYKDGKLPIFSLHAKTMVVDDSIIFIGTFNLDPRSENLNTEVGVIAKHDELARAVKREIEIDMSEGNSWNVKKDGRNNDTSAMKRGKLFFLKLLPIDPIL